jgi:hypothetical protein
MAYVNAGSWQSGWTSRTVHLVVGVAARHGNARYTKVSARCGITFNPGHRFEQSELVNLPEAFTQCSSCKTKVEKSAVQVRPTSVCAQCGETNRSTKSSLCGFCREWNKYQEVK